jgi:hypothetical protein
MLIDQLPTLASPIGTDEIPIERGTTTYKTPLSNVINTSGTNYCKMPDGTLICWGKYSMTLTASDYSAWGTSGWYQRTFTPNISFPVNFISVPSVTAVVNNDIWGVILRASASVSAINNMVFCRYNSYAGTVEINWQAMGRWK